jgi:hypothetical protein
MRPTWEQTTFQPDGAFNVVASAGGAYDDSSFLAGVQFEGVRLALRLGDPVHEALVYPDLIPQIELVARRYGYRCRVEYDDDGWAAVTLHRLASLS